MSKVKFGASGATADTGVLMITQEQLDRYRECADALVDIPNPDGVTELVAYAREIARNALHYYDDECNCDGCEGVRALRACGIEVG
jgi:hypothetical protein